MTIKKILIVAGTHGNEINPIWAVNQLNKEQNNVDKDIEYNYIIGNPLAYEKGSRYVDEDLNRSFNSNIVFRQKPLLYLKTCLSACGPNAVSVKFTKSVGAELGI